jgi:hypothetical protein
VILSCEFIIGCPEAVDIQWVGCSEYREEVMRHRIEEIARWRSEGFKQRKKRTKISNELVNAT